MYRGSRSNLIRKGEMIMKNYELPEWEIILLDKECVIRSSPPFNYGNDDEDDWGEDPWD